MKNNGSLLLVLFFILFSNTGSSAQPLPVLDIIDLNDESFSSLIENGDLERTSGSRFTNVGSYKSGYVVKENEGRSGSAAYCENPGNNEYGLSWTFNLNQTKPQPVRMSAWSRAESVTGSVDSGYSLYIDIVYTDGTPSWGHNVPFNTGTHDWEQQTLIVSPDKPIRTVSCYALFRNHTGRVWFDDFFIGEMEHPAETFPFDGLPARVVNPINDVPNPNKYSTKDGLELLLDPANGAVPAISLDGNPIALSSSVNGLLARDAGTGSDFYSFSNGHCDVLNLSMDINMESVDYAIRFTGTLTDKMKTPRAITLVFALPVDAGGWTWGDHVRETRSIAGEDEYNTYVNIGTGVNGKLSRYPFASIASENAGLALGIDLGAPCQWRLGYNGGAKAFYLAMDFGLHPSTERFPSAAPFAFVLYRIDPKWGFRSAADRYYKLFPDYFAVRSAQQGIWMPFTDISTVQGWQDFGFMYHEGTNNIPFDDSAGILSFRYSEPSTWWMRMPKETPRTYEAAMEMVRNYAESSQNSESKRNAQALLSSGSFDENGRYQLQFRDEPWCDGAVFSLNPSPYIEGEVTEAKSMWTSEIARNLYGPQTRGVQDGEYLDSLEGYVTADLNFREDHFRVTTVPLTFTSDTHRPVIHKAFAQYEFTRYLGEQMHAMNKLHFANSVPTRFSLLCPWLDIMGTETNWIQNGRFAPDSDELMNYRRTLTGGKPYLFLMNTRFDDMTPEIVELYFQRCLFYGMFPSMFSHNASSDPYWQNPTLYNRDRPLFKRYQPLIKEVAEAGWQPVTLAVSNRDSIWVERFGSDKDGRVFLTVLNSGTREVDFTLRGDGYLDAKGTWEEKLSQKRGYWDHGLTSSIEAGAVRVYAIEISNTSSVQEPIQRR